MLLTKSELSAQFQELGVKTGDTVCLHSSLSSLGYVLGGAQTVVRSLIEILGEQGTLIMPAFSPHVSDPQSWSDNQICENDLNKARMEVPCFDLRTTPTTMGVIPEVFRNWPGTVRSEHPQVSVCASGKLAESIISPHNIEWGEGKGSPFERLYQLDAKILILGVGFNRITLLHYAESLVPQGRRKQRRIPIEINNSRSWKQVQDVGDDLNTHFPIIGEKFISEGKVTQKKVGAALCGLMSSKQLVDFAINYFEDVFNGDNR